MEEKIINAKQQTTAIILVGGRSRRMNYQDKMDLKFGDESFLERILSELSVFDQIVISANHNQIEELEKKSFLISEEKVRIVEDIYVDIGPLGGIYSVMEAIESKYYFVASCDIPFIKKEQVEELYREMDENTKVIVGTTGERVHPLFAIYDRVVKPMIYNQIMTQDYRMMNLIEKSKFIVENEVKYVPINEEESLKNINSLDDLYNLKKKVRKN